MLPVATFRSFIERFTAVVPEDLTEEESAQLLHMIKEITDIAENHHKIIRSRMEKAKGKFQVPGFKLLPVVSNGSFRNLIGMVKVLQDKAQCTVAALIERGALTGNAAKMRTEWAEAYRLFPEEMAGEKIELYMTSPEHRVRLCEEK